MDMIQITTDAISTIIEDIHLNQNHTGLEQFSNTCHEAIRSGHHVVVQSTDDGEQEQLQTHEQVTDFVERILSMSQFIG